MKLKKILLPTDFSVPANLAFYHAASLAELYEASITLLYILEDRHGPLSLEHDPELLSKLQHESESELNDYAREHKYEGIPIGTKVIHSHSASDVIIQEAANFDMIIMGSHGRRTLGKRLLGSVSLAVLHETSIPLLLTRGDFHAVPQRILLPVDFSDTGKPALDYALSIAEKANAHLDILHVVENLFVPGPYIPIYNPFLDSFPELKESLLKEMQNMISDTSLSSNSTYIIKKGNPAGKIIDHADESGADLIVLASHGLTGLDRFLVGSVAEKVTRSAGCPVLLLPAFSK